MRHEHSLDPDYFEGMFRESPDPWDFETSAYEQAKYARTLAALDGRVRDRGFEIGCANGALTARLAPLCRTLLAIDVSETALAAARRRCAALPAISFARMAFPREQPAAAAFDLVLLSEVAYYWDDADIARAGDWLRGGVAPGGDLLLVHWTGDTDYPQSGDGAVDKLRDRLTGRIDIVRADRTPDYRLDLWRMRA